MAAKKSTAKKSTKKAKKTTHIALVIDRSGSMGSVRQAALDGLNEQIQTIKKNAKKGGETFVTLVQFDTTVTTIFANKPAKELKELTLADYIPQGVTAMRDGIYTAIQALKAASGWNDPVKPTVNIGISASKSVHVTVTTNTPPVENKDQAFLIVVISDGQENASKEISAHQLAEETRKLEASGEWTFTYMLSNVDAKLTTSQLGISNFNNVSAYVSTNDGTTKSFAEMSKGLDSYLLKRSVGLKKDDGFYKKDSK